MKSRGKEGVAVVISCEVMSVGSYGWSRVSDESVWDWARWWPISHSPLQQSHSHHIVRKGSVLHGVQLSTVYFSSSQRCTVSLSVVLYRSGLSDRIAGITDTVLTRLGHSETRGRILRYSDTRHMIIWHLATGSMINRHFCPDHPLVNVAKKNSFKLIRSTICKINLNWLLSQNST